MCIRDRPKVAHGAGEGTRGHRRIHAAGRLAGQHDAVEAGDAFAGQRAPAGIPAHLVAFVEMRGEGLPQVNLVDRRGAQEQRVPRLEAQFAGDQPRLAMHRGIVEQFRHCLLYTSRCV